MMRQIKGTKHKVVVAAAAAAAAFRDVTEPRQPHTHTHLCNTMKGPYVCHLLQSDTRDPVVALSHTLEFDPVFSTTHHHFPSFSSSFCIFSAVTSRLFDRGRGVYGTNRITLASTQLMSGPVCMEIYEKRDLSWCAVLTVPRRFQQSVVLVPRQPRRSVSRVLCIFAWRILS